MCLIFSWLRAKFTPSKPHIDDEENASHVAVGAPLLPTVLTPVFDVASTLKAVEDKLAANPCSDPPVVETQECVDGPGLCLDDTCWWNSTVEQICGPLPSSSEAVSKDLLQASKAFEGRQDVYCKSPTPSSTPATSCASKFRDTEQRQGRRVSSATTLLHYSSNDTSTTRESFNNFQSEEMPETMSELSLEVERLKAELQTTQAKLEHFESNPTYTSPIEGTDVAPNETQFQRRALNMEFKNGGRRSENNFSGVLEEKQPHEELLADIVERQNKQLEQLEPAFESVCTQTLALTEDLKEQMDRETALKETFHRQLKLAQEDYAHVELAAEKAQSRERELAKKFKEEQAWRQVRENEMMAELEKTQAEAKRLLAENTVLHHFASSLQDEDILPEDAPMIVFTTGYNCGNCMDLTHHISKLRRSNTCMAMKLKEYRFIVDKKVVQIRQCQALAEGRPEEKEIEAQELVKLLEIQLSDLRANNFTLCDQITQEVKACTEAKLRAELEVDRLTNLCAFKDVQIASFEADIERVDSLQLHNAELLDMVSDSEVDSTVFEQQSERFAEEVSALTNRANTFEVQAEIALKEAATRRVEFYEQSKELAQLREALKTSNAEKTESDLRLGDMQFVEEVREEEKRQLGAAHNATVQGLEATIDNLRDQKERFLREIPDDLVERVRYLYFIKCDEIDHLRATVNQLSQQIDQLQQVNGKYAYYACAYETLEAEANLCDWDRNVRADGEARFGRALRSILENEYGTVDHLYRQALEKMNRDGAKIPRDQDFVDV